MSASYLNNQIQKLEKEIADLEKKSAAEKQKEVGKLKQINSIERSINANTSQSSLLTKQNQINRHQTQISNIQKIIADYRIKIAKKSEELSKKKAQFAKEHEKERKSQFDREKKEIERLKREQERIQQNIREDLEKHNNMLSDMLNQQKVDTNSNSTKKYDFFISHASEDKDFVRPLAKAITNKGHNVWYDEVTLSVGDSLRKKIDEGLKYSRYGIIVFSKSFFEKYWTDYELNGFITREMNADGLKVILPIWHKISKDEMMAYSLSLADKLALNTTIYSTDEIAEKLIEQL